MKMKVYVEISKSYSPPYAVIYTSAVTKEVQKVIDRLEMNDAPLIARQDDRMTVLNPDEVFLIRVESGETVIYTETEKYGSRKRLYETLEQLGGGFMQISKQAVINLSCIKCVEVGFGGNLLIRLKNGLSDYVTRKYLPAFKNYLGL